MASKFLHVSSDEFYAIEYMHILIIWRPKAH